MSDNAIELSKCPKCGQNVRAQLKHGLHTTEFRCTNSNCRFGQVFLGQESDGIPLWNQLCAEITTGRAMLEAVPDGHQLRGEPLVSSMHVIWDTEFIAPPLSKEAVLKLWVERYAKHADPGDLGLKRLLADTDAVLGEQGKDGG